MTGFLLDTNVLSALAPGKAGKPPVDPELALWMEANSDALYLSVVTAIEIESGLLKLGRTAPGRWHNQLSNWFSTVLTQYADRFIAVDLRVARIASLLADRSRADGVQPGLADTTIAATAVAHDLTVLTRNLKHFASLGIRSVDPFAEPPT